ncbi:hypothetical protein IWX90DRAFT_142737 [Phyllosticta citrichinensis]|uniref:Uncharacterized protein n=1 Tax=Phyllosticta citrichinensis TaxID=1130410 RepID=A0ABR1XYS2_9PEZI
MDRLGERPSYDEVRKVKRRSTAEWMDVSDTLHQSNAKTSRTTCPKLPTSPLRLQTTPSHQSRSCWRQLIIFQPELPPLPLPLPLPAVRRSASCTPTSPCPSNVIRVEALLSTHLTNRTSALLHRRHRRLVLPHLLHSNQPSLLQLCVSVVSSFPTPPPSGCPLHDRLRAGGVQYHCNASHDLKGPSTWPTKLPLTIQTCTPPPPKPNHVRNYPRTRHS